MTTATEHRNAKIAAANFRTDEIADLSIMLDKVGRAIGDMNDDAFDLFVDDIRNQCALTTGNGKMHAERLAHVVNLIDQLRDVWE